MHRVTGATLGAVGIGLVAVFLVAGFVLGGLPMAPLASPSHSAKSTTTTDVAPVASPAVAKGSSTPVSPARVYQTQIAIYLNQVGTFSTVNYWYTSAVPTDLTFSTNITWGAISSADTHVWVNITDEFTEQFRSLTYPTNFSFNPANVVLYNNNGVLYSNYTWTVGLNASNLGCGTATSCGKVLVNDDYYQIAVTVLENGASMSGGWATSTAYEYVYLVSTFTNGLFILPGPAVFQTPVPFSVEFMLNTSWGYTTNKTTNVTFYAYDYDTGATYWVSYNGTLGTTAVSHNGVSVTSTLGFNGTVDGIQYSAATFYVTLNQSFFGKCAYYSCNTTFGTGHDVGIYAYVVENGTSAGGYPGLFEIYPIFDEFTVGSTLFFDGQSTFAYSPQGLPVTLSGWLNTTWVNPSTAAGNHTITGYIQVWNATTDAVLTYISMNNSVGTVNSNGFSLMPVISGTVPVYGITYTNYTWSVDLSATNLGSNLPYGDYYWADFYITANGSGAGNGGVVENQFVDCAPFCDTNFAEYPTTVSVAVSPALPGYVPLNYVQNFTIAVTNAPITPLNTLVVVTIYDATLSKEFGAPIIVSTTDIAPADNQTFYQFTFSPYAMTCSDPTCLFTTSLGFAPSPTDVYTVNITVYVDGTYLPTNGTFAVSYYQSSFYLIFVPLTFYLVSPTPSAVLTPGNVTVSVYFVGTFISGPLVLDIYSPTGALVLAESFAVSGQNFTWVLTSAGTYHASLAATTAYLTNGKATHYSNTTLVVTKVPRIYINSTAYSNATLVPGLSAAGAGTLLLILGLIIGMIVALLLGRAVWGGRQAPSPPQAWETKPAEGAGAGAAGGAAAGTAAAAGANTCSVCGKSFATPEELTAHGKSEHGME